MDAFTVGAEEEYQLVEPGSGALVSRARDVLETDWAGEAQPEAQETMLEVRTRVCESAAEVERELRRLRFHVATAAAAEDLVLVAAGLHPFSRWEDQRTTKEPRYRRLSRRYGRVLKSEHTFGMHIHVAVPDGVDRMPILTRLRFYLPHLVALAASSPVYEGRDTGYDSYRTVLTDRYPGSGPPPAFASEDEYRAFVETIVAAGTVEDRGSVYWSMRPHHVYPTVEVRCVDVCPRVSEAAALVALTRAMVAAAAMDRLPSPFETPRPSLEDALLRSNAWQAARYGLDARIAGRSGGAPRPIAREIERLLEAVQPVAKELGDAEFLAPIHAILENGNAAARMRRAAAEREDLPAVMRWLTAESLLGTGMDRRSRQREGSDAGPI